MANVEYKAVDPVAAARAENPDTVAHWGGTAEEDVVLSILTGGNGDMYLVDTMNRIYVQFDASDHDQVHAAARWVSVFIESTQQ